MTGIIKDWDMRHLSFLKAPHTIQMLSAWLMAHSQKKSPLAFPVTAEAKL